MEAAQTEPLLTPRNMKRFGTGSVKTMYEAGKAQQIASEMTSYNIKLVEISETRWINSGTVKLTPGQTILYSGHEREGTFLTQGVSFMVSKEA